MMKLVRLLIVLAVALAVPLQGAAAVAAGQCMAFGHHESGMGMSHDHGDGHENHDAHHGAPEQQAQDHDASGDHCAPCVACCAAAAISTPFQPFIADPLKDPVLALTGKSFSGIAPETLDRPPLAF